MNTSEWLDNVGAAACSSRETLQHTYDLARLAIEQGIPGDFVECGVFAGSQCAAMARAIEGSMLRALSMKAMDTERADAIKRSTKRVHLFDSFEGVPAPSAQDGEWIAAGHPVGQSACSLERVKAHMEQWGVPEELLVYHPGWFNNTMHEMFAIQQGYGVIGHPQGIALLRIDCDLYESTRLVLKNLYPLVSPGGFIVVDDYALDGCRQAVSEYFQGSAPGPIYFRKV